MADAALEGEIFIVDDDDMVCDALSTAFALEGFRVRTFGDGISFIDAARARPPACVLLDVHMPGKSGLDILKELDGRCSDAPIFIMSGRGDIPTAVEAIKNGAHDFVEKHMSAGLVAARVRAAVENWMHQRHRRVTTPASLDFPGGDRLTPREREVLEQVVAAASNREAAQNLGISKRTVDIHRGHIMQKLGAKNSVDLMRIVMSRRRDA